MEHEAPEGAQAPEALTRRERLAAGRRRRRLRLAAALAAAGLAAVAVALTWQPASDSTPASTRSAGRESDTSVEGVDPGKPPSNAPGGVGPAPEKTGLPAISAPGGRVRTGPEDEGCFPDVRSYLDEWHRTGEEPDPCFTTQPPSDQKQPDGVRRTYNGERF